MRVFVLDKFKKPLMPCHPARARALLAKGSAAVFRQAPFTIILIDCEGGVCQDISLNIDPGSKITGVALVADFDKGLSVIWAAHLKHRGTPYQKGTFFGYEVREYLLEKWGRKCAYCEKADVRLEIGHIIPKSSGGTNAVGNLAICCRNCNEKKGNKALQDFLKHPEKVKEVLPYSKRTLKDAAAVNASRLAVGEALIPLGKPFSHWSGGQTKYNRTMQGFPKEHWLDAACVGDQGISLTIPNGISVLEITANGRGSRQKCLVNRFGFPRSAPKTKKRVLGFQTGDLVSAVVPSGKKQGRYRGCVAIRATGNFNIQTPLGVVHRTRGFSSALLRN
jgi:hypothetical protein